MPSARPVSLSGYWAILRGNRNFRLLWTAQIISEIGDWFYTVAIYSLLLEFTGSAKSVALAFVLQVLPQFFASPTAGVINDRVSRRAVMLFTDFARAGIVACMLLIRGPETVWLLYSLLLIETLMWALFEPARTAVIPNITTAEEVVTANTLSSITWSFNFAIGSAVGGVIAAFFGRHMVFGINAASFILSGLLIQRMCFQEPHLKDLPPFHVRDLFNFHPITEGLRYVRANSRLAVTMLVKAGIGLMGANWVILPLLGRDSFPVHGFGLTQDQSATLGMSVLLGSRGIGAICGPLIAGYFAGGREERLRPGIAIGFLIAAAGYGLLSYCSRPVEASICVALGHAGSSIAWVFSTTLLQLNTDDRFRGRVFSVEFGFSVLTMSAMSTAAAFLIDRGATPFRLAAITGCAMLIPAIGWIAAMRIWRGEPRRRQ